MYLKMSLKNIAFVFFLRVLVVAVFMRGWSSKHPIHFIHLHPWSRIPISVPTPLPRRIKHVDCHRIFPVDQICKSTVSLYSYNYLVLFEFVCLGVEQLVRKHRIGSLTYPFACCALHSDLWLPRRKTINPLFILLVNLAVLTKCNALLLYSQTFEL